MGTAVAALSTAIEREYKAMERYARRKFANREDALEALHDGIAKALDYSKRNPSYAPQNWKHWLWRVLKNTITDHYRRINYSTEMRHLHNHVTPPCYDGEVYSARQHDPNSNEDTQPIEEPELCYRTDYAGDIAARQEAESRRLKLRALIDMLPAQQKRTLLLFYYEGHMGYEVGSIIWPGQARERASASAQSSIRRGRVSLKSLIMEHAPEVRLHAQ